MRQLARYSKLCLADKLAFVLTPALLYLPMARLSGELREYMRVSSERQQGGKVSNFELSLLKSRNPQVWLEGLKLYTQRWVEQHRNGFHDADGQHPHDESEVISTPRRTRSTNAVPQIRRSWAEWRSRPSPNLRGGDSSRACPDHRHNGPRRK